LTQFHAIVRENANIAGFNNNQEESKGMVCPKFRVSVIAAALAYASLAIASDDPRHVRHELMENVGKAAKPIGKMLKGERDFDVNTLMSSLKTFDDASGQLGDLFPPDSKTGEDTQAAPAIWEDRAGFEEALATWQKAVGDAIAAEPATLEAAKPVAGAVFKACKGCHETYRLEEE
jgi:cytochrome c556